MCPCSVVGIAKLIVKVMLIFLLELFENLSWKNVVSVLMFSFLIYSHSISTNTPQQHSVTSSAMDSLKYEEDAYAEIDFNVGGQNDAPGDSGRTGAMLLVTQEGGQSTTSSAGAAQSNLVASPVSPMDSFSEYAEVSLLTSGRSVITLLQHTRYYLEYLPAKLRDIYDNCRLLSGQQQLHRTTLSNILGRA